MSCKTVITCDFCDATITGKPCYVTPLGAAFDMERGTIYGCSKKHLALALAKAFGVPIAPPSNAISEMVEGWANPANEVTSVERAQYDQTIELQKQRIAELEKDAEEKAVVARAYIVSLEKRLAELSTPLSVDGKTPGQVDYEGYFFETPDDATTWPNLSPVKRNRHERAAQAVLRAFGQSGQTPQTNAVGALRWVRERVESMGAQPAEESFKTDVLEAIAHELAKLKGIERDTNGSANPHDGCLDCNGTGWSGGNVRNGACDIPLKAKQ